MFETTFEPLWCLG